MQLSKPVSVLLGAALMMAAGTFAWAAAEGEDNDGGGAAAMAEGGGVPGSAGTRRHGRGRRTAAGLPEQYARDIQ